MSEDLPKIMSDEEFATLLKQREQADRPEFNCWDNTAIRTPPKHTDGLPESTLEQKFPRIAQNLTGIWRSEACADFIKDLVVNVDRDTREGFPVDVIEDLLMLAEINEILSTRTGPGSAFPTKPAWPNSGRR